jgi:hypothetical protein
LGNYIPFVVDEAPHPMPWLFIHIFTILPEFLFIYRVPTCNMVPMLEGNFLNHLMKRGA